MRFQNLTRTLTRSSLSIVAIAAFVLLPITNGICSWTGGESSKSYYTNSVNDGKGWHLSASLSASRSGASSSVSPSIYAYRLFTSSQKYSGSASVEAWRAAYTTTGGNWHHYPRSWYSGTADPCMDRSYSIQYGDYLCNGHPSIVTVPEAVDNNYGSGDEDTLLAEVVMGTVTMQHIWGEGTSDVTGQTVTGEINISLSEYGALTGKYQWTDQNGVTLTETRSTTVSVPGIPIELSPISQGASVDGDARADSTADASFSFETASDAAFVTYTAD